MDAPINLFRNVSDRVPCESRRMTLPQIAGLLRKPRAVAAKDKAGLVTFNEYKEPKAGRGTDNIAACHAIAGDIDGAFDRATLEAGLAELEHVGAFAIAYQTWSSRPEAERWRVFAFLDEPVSPADYRVCWHGLNDVFGGMLDANAKDAARISYLPSHPQGQSREVRIINEALWTA